MSVSFNEYFVGEYNGYEVLYHNMKYGLNASKELADFLRERSNVEETNSKLLTKLAKQANGSCNQGTFAPMWSVLRHSAEKLSTLHQHMFQKVSELVKDVSRYADDLHKKHKAVKDSESGTLEVALILQSTKQTLHKAKDLYTTKSSELEKAKENSAKDVEKLEVKVKKLHDDYKSLLEKYSIVKQEFEKKMSLTCKHFQDVEESHLKQMKQFMNTYIDLVQSNHHLVGQVHVDMKHQCMEMSVDKLLEQFVVEKYSSMEKAEHIDVNASISKPISANNSISESDHVTAITNGSHKNTSTIMKLKKEPSLASKTSRRTTSLLNLFTPFQSKDEPSGSIDGATPCSAPSSPSGTPAPPPQDKGDVGRNNLRESKWFLRSRRTKPKLKKSSKKKKEEGGEATAPTEDKSDLEEKEEETVSKDMESIQSPQVDEDGYCVRPKEDKGSIYSTSDSDSEEEREQKIHVEIKPLNGGGPMSASVDELLATVENLSLFPTRRGSTAHSGKPSSDLLGLNLFHSPTGSHPSSPLAVSPYAPLPAASTPTPSPDVGDLFSEVGDMKPTTPSAASTIAIPRPPSRRSEPGEFRTAGVTGSSRGPSPLTIGMADTIPLAVAFHEIIHSYFRGTDESKCQVKMSGDMMLSFPTGIVGVLANNPNPAKLSFRLRNTSKLDNITPNKQLVAINTLQSTGDNTVLEFNMPALTSLLKRQSEKNPGASYFNVDILKYQVKPKYGAASCPFQLVSYWKCEATHTALKIDYKYNLHAMSSPSPLLNLSVSVPINGGIDKVTAMPSCQTVGNGDAAGILWKFTELSQHSDNHGVGSLRARAEIATGPSTRATITAQFNCEGATLSGIEFELLELEKLNTATAEINKLELELDESNTTFRMLLNEATRRLKGLAARLGNSVEKARPYHEAAEAAAQARTACQRAAVQYQRASEIHAAAKETVALAEQRFKSKQNEWQFDNAWQEMLNHATIKVMDAEHQKAESGREHMKRAQTFNTAEHRMQQLEDHLRKSIIKSRPYFEEKQLCQEQLNTQKERIQQLQEEVQKVKERYAKSLRALEAISEEIHRKRRALYGDSEECPVGPREPGVGAEKDSVNDFSEEPDRHDLEVRKSGGGTPDSCKEDTHGLEELRRRVRRLAARPLEGGEPPEDSWEQELNTTVQKLDQMLLAREQQAREKERKAQSMHSSYDKLSDTQHFETITRSQSYFDNSDKSKPLNQYDFTKLIEASTSKTNAQIETSSSERNVSDGEFKSIDSPRMKDVRDSKSDGSPCKSIDSSRSNLATQLCLSVTNLQDLLQPGTPHHFIPNATYELPQDSSDERYFEELAGNPAVFPHDAVFERGDSTNINASVVNKMDMDVKASPSSSAIGSPAKDNVEIKMDNDSIIVRTAPTGSPSKESQERH